jgi:hypothetical protein
MNGQERLTLEEINDKLEDYITADNARWKRIEPAINAYYNQKVIEKFLNACWKGLVAILALLATIGFLWEKFLKK